MSVVSIVKSRGKSLEDAVREAVSMTDSFKSTVLSGMTVLIKPNLVGPSRSGSGNVTDARVTEAVAKLVLERNPKRVIIGEGSGVGYDFPGRRDTMMCMEASGTSAVAEKLGLELVDLNRDRQVKVTVPDAYVMDTFSVAETAWEADVIICLPVMKTHIRTGITCSLKNMKGVLPGNEKKRTHQLGLDRGIIDLNRLMKPDFTVVDGLVGMQGVHAGEEDKVPLGIVAAGSDAVAVDAVCGSVMGFDVDQILHVKLADEAGIGVANLSQIDVRGEKIEDVKRPFVPFQRAAQDRFGGATIIEKNTCTGCMGEIFSTFIYLDRAGFRDNLADLTLIMGTPDHVPAPRGTPVVIGRCAREFRHLGVFVPGCPPHGIKITDAACEALGIDRQIVHRTIEELHGS
jgi:uncharacterized protein (DUF362 family)